MKGLKIKDAWLRLILSGQKTMEVRSLHFTVKGTRIALGNSSTGNVEGYATVADVIKIPYLQITSYENQHRASRWLMQRYKEGAHLYGYVLRDVKEEKSPFPYPKGPGIGFYIRAEGTL